MYGPAVSRKKFFDPAVGDHASMTDNGADDLTFLFVWANESDKLAVINVGQCFTLGLESSERGRANRRSGSNPNLSILDFQHVAKA
jgi:hypothetical protein